MTGFTNATYKLGPGSRKELVLDHGFIVAFTAAKARIKAMEYRWVEEIDPTCQCLLEIYAAVTLSRKLDGYLPSPSDRTLRATPVAHPFPDTR